MTSSKLKQNLSSESSYVDVFRGIAILLVIAVHTGQAFSRICSELDCVTEYSTPIIRLTSYGLYGVQVFFVISGFLIAGLYSDPTNWNWRQFALRRFLRIFPLWFVFLLVTIAESQINGFGGWSSVTKTRLENWSALSGPILIILMTITFTLFISPIAWNSIIPGGWSIQAEVGNYFAFALFRKFRINTICIFILLLSAIKLLIIEFQYANYQSENLGGVFLRMNFASNYYFFMIGVIASKIHTLKFKWRSIKIHWRTVAIIAIISLLQIKDSLIFGNFITALAILSVCAGAAYCLNSFHISQKPFSAIGRVSYFVYFFHFHLLWVITGAILRLFHARQIFLNNGIAELAFGIVSLYFATVSISFIAGLFSMKYFEKRFIKLAHKEKLETLNSNQEIK